ncbi:MAG: hypothetical protein M5U26_11090 [Planctomycetota bacterium]|nr:hypothetical protein [Planctomycetota bacterium]
MSGRPVRTPEVTADDRVKRAYGIMSDIRAKLYRRLADFVLANESRFRAETLSEDSYSFCLQQMEDQFLNKLNVVERAVVELARSEHPEAQTTTTTYETVEVVAKRDELPQKIADVLAEHAESDFLDMCVLRCDDEQAEVIVVLAREDAQPSGAEPVQESASADGDSETRGESDDIT